MSGSWEELYFEEQPEDWENFLGGDAADRFEVLSVESGEPAEDDWWARLDQDEQDEAEGGRV